MPQLHTAEAQKLDRLVFGDGAAGARSAGTHSPDTLGAQRYGEDNAMRRGQNGDKNDKGASGETANPSSCLWLRGAGFEPATFGL